MFLRQDIALRCVINTIRPTPERVISNFFQGMFLAGGRSPSWGPYWSSLPQRAVITRESAHLSQSLKRYMRRGTFEIKKNQNFEEVIRSCKREDHTWINDSIIKTYMELHEMGYAKSWEAYKDGKLVGGLWGLELGKTFSIMSMFHVVNRAGSNVLGTLVKKLKKGEYDLIDCGGMNNNFKRYGAVYIPLEEFIEKVESDFYRQNTDK